MIPFRLGSQPGVPVADQAVFAAKKAIFAGKFHPGDPFPSVRTLARELKIHANTAQKVIAQLASEGFLEVQPGIGTIVARPPSPRGARARLLRNDIEQLAVQALQLGVPLDELESELRARWSALTGEVHQS